MEHGPEKNKSPEKSPKKIVEEDVDTQEEMKEVKIHTREEVPIEVESISTKFPIVDWKTCVLTETFMYYQVFRGDGSSKNYKILSEMLEDFDRLDTLCLEPDKDVRFWKIQHEYKFVTGDYNFYGIAHLLMENGLAIHMLTEKKYPLSQEMISKMLKKKLEVDHESLQAIELLRLALIIISEEMKHTEYYRMYAEVFGIDVPLT
ncbi:hypothetical protein Tco_0733248 [Tanacetum coccineum]